MRGKVIKSTHELEEPKRSVHSDQLLSSTSCSQVATLLLLRPEHAHQASTSSSPSRMADPTASSSSAPVAPQTVAYCGGEALSSPSHRAQRLTCRHAVCSLPPEYCEFGSKLSK